MINFNTPLSLFASCIWNISEKFNIKLGKLAPIIFGLMIQKQGKKKDNN